MKIRHVVAAVVVVVAATGCGSTPKPAADRPSASATPTVSVQQRFLSLVSGSDIPSTSWSQVGPADEELEAYPPQWCQALGQGHSVGYILGSVGMYPRGSDWGTNIIDARALVVDGVSVYCPRYRDQVVSELRSQGLY